MDAGPLAVGYYTMITLHIALSPFVRLKHTHISLYYCVECLPLTLVLLSGVEYVFVGISDLHEFVSTVNVVMFSWILKLLA